MRRQSLFGGIAAAIFVIVVSSSSAMARTQIQGTVTDINMNPLENVVVFPWPLYDSWDTTDAQGYYYLDGLPINMTRVAFYHYDYFDTSIWADEWPEGDSITLDVILNHRPQYDIAPVKFINRIYENTPFIPQVEIMNNGLQSVTFDIYYELFSPDSGNVLIGDTLININSSAHSADTITFNRSITLPPYFHYTLMAHTYLSMDENPANDTCRVTGTIPRDFFIIYGNRDGSVMPVHNNQLLEIPVWGGTPYGNVIDSIGFMHIPLASDDNFISQRLGGTFPDTLVGRWDDRSFMAIDNHNTTPEIPEGYSNQSILGFAYITPPRDEQNFFITNGDTVLIAVYRMRVTSDSSIIGDTIQPFITGFNNANGGLNWGDQGTLTNWIPRVSFPRLYIQSLAEWGCHYTPGDLNGNGVANGIDVSYAVSYLKGACIPPIDCNPPCTELSDPFYAALDVNGSCTVNGIDITYLVSYFKGGASLTYCHACPPAE
jgi:hypothetical protein